jgi:hypothetical protein
MEHQAGRMLMLTIARRRRVLGAPGRMREAGEGQTEQKNDSQDAKSHAVTHEDRGTMNISLLWLMHPPLQGSECFLSIKKREIFDEGPV